MLADRVDQLRPRQTAGLDRFLNVLDFLRRERAPGQEFWCSVPHQHAAAPNGPPYHLKTVFSCPLLFRDKKNLQVGPSCSISSAKQTRRQSWHAWHPCSRKGTIKSDNSRSGLGIAILARHKTRP